MSPSALAGALAVAVLASPAALAPPAATPPASATTPPAAVKTAAAQANVVSDGVRGIRVAEAPRDTAVLVVLVVDDVGDPLDEIAVTVLSRSKEIATEKSDSRGRALFRLSTAGVVSVRAAADGFVPSAARAVTVRKGGLTALALPLEQKEPEQP